MHRLLNSLKFHLPYFIFLAVTSHDGLSQGKYKIEHFTSDNGLPQNTIKSIAADRLGFIWLATDGGLVRYNGIKFQTFNINKLGLANAANLYGIEPVNRTAPTSYATVGERSRFGRSFAIYDSGESVRIENGRAVRDSTHVPEYIAIKKRFGPKTPVYAISGIPDIFGANITKSGITISDGTGEGNFYWCDDDSVRYFVKWRLTEKMANKVDNLLTYFVLNNRLYNFNRTTTTITQFIRGQKSHYSLDGDILKNPFYRTSKHTIRLYWNPNVNQAFLLLSNHLYLLTASPNGALTTTLLIQGFDFSTNDIDLIYYDHQSHKLFLGSGTIGLFVMTFPSFETITVNGKDRPNIFYAQIPFDSSHVLTPTGFVIGQGKNRGTTTQVKSSLQIANPQDKRFITTDLNQNIWTKNTKTLLKLDPNADKVKSKILFPGFVRGISLINDRQICVGVYEKGLFVLDTSLASSKMAHFLGNYSTKISCLSYRGKDQLLVGTEEGLFQVNFKNRTVWAIKGTEGLRIESVNPVTYNEVWITARSQGLLLLNNEKSAFSFPLDKNGHLVTAHCVVDDELGFLWITTNRGLFQISKVDLMNYHSRQTTGDSRSNPPPFYLLHVKKEGFNTNEFNGSCSPCGLKMKNGTISFPSLDGLVWFDPRKIHPVLPSDDITLDRLEVDMNDIVIESDTIKLPISPENVRFYFSTAYFGERQNLDLSYALVTHNSDRNKVIWKPLINEEDIVIQWSTLPAGKYVLLIKKQSGFGSGNQTIKEIFLEIPEIWYRTTWALIIFTFLGLYLIVICTQYYNRKKISSIRKENLALEKLILMRTESLRTALSKLEDSNAVISDQLFGLSRMLASISHDVQTPLNFINYSSAKVPTLIEKQQLHEAAKVVNMITAISERTTRMVQDLLSYTKIQVYGKRIKLEDISISSLVHEKIDFFQTVIEQKNNRIKFDFPEELFVYNDRQLLSIIIHNLIDNATKYTKNGEISFQTIVGSGLSELVISNNGHHLPDEVINLFNEVEISERNPHNIEEHGNLGLIMVKEIAQLIGIQITTSYTEKINFHIRF
jgi:signal transduction histidine kinase